MPNLRLASRYAKSLFGLALETGELEKVFDDMKLLHEVCKQSRDFVNLLHSPIVPADKKEKIFSSIFKGKVRPLTASFVRLLVNKGRENNFLEITTSFIDQYKEYKGIQIVKLTTAVPVGDDIKKDIIKKVKSRINAKELELEEKVNPEVIGGFRLELRDFLIDATVEHVLEKAKAQFRNNDFVFRLR